MITALENWQPARQPAPLRAGEVHLWQAHLTPTPELSATLSPADWVRAERFHFAVDRDRFIATRGLLRTILATYLDAEPHELRFRTGPHGKPELDGFDTSLRFNLSHSDELMLLAVTHARDIGVDLEFMRGNVPFETLADHYFDPEEAWDLRNLPAAERAWKFYDTWTCTEARLKAHGVGLAHGFHVVEPDRWSLLKLTPAAGYAAALAVEGGDFQLECWSWRK
ncbi:MAG: 4'-phosphopantetheinyl transferase superfamily protein [Chthoniobacter sp.]|nr:4'-phosphopantetheinyl transferase superfamily protein [Chthoniobacter sp.]